MEMLNREEWAPNRLNPADFDNYLPWACTQLSVETKVVVTRTYMSEYLGTVTSNHPKKKSRKSKMPSYTEISSETSEVTSDPSGLVGFETENKMYIDTVYDSNFDLVQLKILKNKTIPRLVMKIIGLIIPFHKYLSSIIINSGLHSESIYEISRFLPVSQITDLCFDYTYLIEANYHILLDQSALKHLSLGKCNINDDVVKTIALKLVHPYPAAKTLRVLNLSSNIITDTGVKHLAEALRTNRHLYYLNLADNLITDKGATSILDTLVEFPLTSEETKNKKARHMIYLKDKLDLVVKMTKELRAGDFGKKVIKRRSVRSAFAQPMLKKSKLRKENSETANYTKSLLAADTAIIERAEAIVQERKGPFSDPFDPDNTIIRDDIVYCYGNNTLCYLNIAYNDLTYFSLEKLQEVLVTQRLMCRRPRGLVNVRIDGNYLPDNCSELVDIDEMLNTGLASTTRLSVKKFPKTGPSNRFSC